MLITECYRTIKSGKRLFAQAPTGTGKTVSVLYPAVRALGAERGEKIFYFTPKTTTARAAKDCTEAMCRCGIKIKAVMIGAKERICKRGLLCKESKRLCPSEGEKKVNAAALALFMLSFSACGEDEKIENQPSEVQGVLSSFNTTDIDSNQVDESVFKGKKLTMINIWATYCGPCINEMPALGKISREYAGEGFQIIGIPVDGID